MVLPLVIPQPVIPAKAGIHVDCLSQTSFVEIIVDSSLRLNDI
jgi:hypothetical protein